MLHFYHPIIYGVVYVIFSVVYQKSGGAPIYSQLDWDKPGDTLLLNIGLLLIVTPL